MALEYYNKATEQADTTAVDCDYGTLARVYNQMGLLFGKQYLITQELAAYEKVANMHFRLVTLSIQLDIIKIGWGVLSFWEN